MKRVNLLRGHQVEPIMVFDGASLPMKGSKHMERRRWVVMPTEVENSSASMPSLAGLLFLALSGTMRLCDGDLRATRSCHPR